MVRYLLDQDIGRSRLEILFELPQKDDSQRSRRPDLAFISYERWPSNQPMPIRGPSRGVVPDLCVEVVSPNYYATELQLKVNDYLSAGVREVWVIHPDTRELHRYDSSNILQRIHEHDEIDGSVILPGFRVRLGDLFPPQLPETRDAT